MNAKKAPPEGRAKKRTFTWLRRGLLAALIAAAAALAWLRLPAPALGRAGARASLSAANARACRRAGTHRAGTAYDKDVAALTALLDSGAADEETRAQAAARLDQLVADHQSELGLEETLNQAGFRPVWCSCKTARSR